MKDWLRFYGWKFLLTLLVAACALAYLIHVDDKGRGGDGIFRVPPAPALTDRA